MAKTTTKKDEQDDFTAALADDEAPASDPPAEDSPPASGPDSDPPPPASDAPPASDGDTPPSDSSESPEPAVAPYGLASDTDAQAASIAAEPADDGEDHRIPWNVSTMGPPPPNHEATYRVIEPPAPVPTVFTPSGKATEPEPLVKF